MSECNQRIAIDFQPLPAGLIASGIFVFAVGFAIRVFLRPAISEKADTQIEFQSSSDSRPTIHPCRITHTRIFPANHSFSYSYLQVSIPVDFEGTHGFVSVGSKTAKSWFHIQDSDYLERGSSPPNLKEKLASFLESQGVSSSEWHHAYLVTAPRFLGYSFNPVSFWYIYSEDRVLTMMILEVNNTFDERRMYLLRNTKGQNFDDDGPVTPEKRTKSGRFKNTWAKDFHVSPFNSRNGSYTLSVSDPFVEAGNIGSIDNTIVLKSSKDRPKLVARIFSEGPTVDPAKISSWTKTRFLAQWCCVGFATFPRIVKQAAVLFFHRKLHVWFRPEVLPTSIGRRPTSAEITLEAFFSKYLEDLVQNCAIHIQVTYHSGLPDRQHCVFKSSRPASGGKPPEQLEIIVLTPAFFSRFVHYAHSSEVFDRECVFTDEKNRTIWVSQPALLPALLDSTTSHHRHMKTCGPLESTRWWIVTRLRCPPTTQTYTVAPQADEGQDIRRMTHSPLDRFVRVHCDDAWVYRRQCIRLFLAGRLVFGYLELIDFIDLSLRVVVIWFGVSMIMEPLTIPSMGSAHLSIAKRLIIASLKIAQISMVHLWAILQA